MREDKLSVLSMRFSVEIFHLSKRLQSQREYLISNQIGRSGMSIGANIREAQYAHSKADFIAKLQIARKEASETGYWLDLLHEVQCLPEADHKRLSAACGELRVILIHSINTAKANLARQRGENTKYEQEKQ